MTDINLATDEALAALALDPRHIFLTAKQVFARFNWGRSKGYEMLKLPGFARPIGGGYRLDLVMAWEDDVAAGRLSDRPANKPETAPPGPMAEQQQAEVASSSNEVPAGTPMVTAAAADEAPVVAFADGEVPVLPTRKRSRTRKDVA